MILVTGAAGSSGSAVVREFSSNGVPVRALVRHRARAGALEGLRDVEIVEGDLARAETLRSALEGVARVLLISSSNPQMLETQCQFIDTCKASGVAHVVKFSGKESGIGFNAENFRFTRMHEEIERYLQGSGLGWTHLRPSQFMQVYLREVPIIVAESALRLPLEDVKLSPVDVDDIAKIAFAILVQAGQERRAFDITGPQALSMAQIAACIEEAVGKPIRYHNLSPEDHRRALVAGGLSPFMVEALVEQAAERRRHPESRVDLGAHSQFGVKPTTFAEFAQRHAAIFRGGAPTTDQRGSRH